MNKIKAEIKTFIVDNFLFGDDKGLEDQTSFMEGAIIDSTGILELVNYLENDFNITISDDELLPENLDSINNIANFLENKISGSKGS
jgi:acyl carrier protein